MDELYTPMSRLNDFNYFIDNYSYLYKKYGSSYIVIQNKKILGSYPDMMTAIKETTKIYVIGSFIVQRCDGTEDAYTNYISSWQLVSAQG